METYERNENVRKINTLGKIANIVINIAKVIIIIGIVCAVAAGILCQFMPKDYITAGGGANAEITVNSSEKGTIFDIFAENLVDTDRVSIGVMGLRFSFTHDKISVGDGTFKYVINASAHGITTKEVKLAVTLAMAYAALAGIAAFVALVFGGKLAKALKSCESPFEDSVTKAMKHFAISLIPFAVISVLPATGINTAAVLIIVCVILFFAYLFRYGAQLQKQSDETL